MKENTFQESLQTVLRACSPMGSEDIGFHQAQGRILAEDVRSPVDDPPHPKSAMDGFALRSEETASATPDRPVGFEWGEVVGAGHLARGTPGNGKAVRLMTGAWMPEGADAVVKLEDTSQTGENTFTVTAPLRTGENIIPAGSRIRKNDRLVAAGTLFSPQALGMAASIGRTRFLAHRRPRVALLALGDELVEIGETLQPGQLYVSNLYALAGKVVAHGCEARVLGIANDNPDLIVQMLEPRVIREDNPENALGCEVVLTLGGSHGGDFDFAEQVVRTLGAEVHFQRTRLNMAASTLFATRGNTLFFGLPGTPVPSWGAFELLVRPALWKLAGRSQLENPLVKAVLTAPLRGWPGRYCVTPGWIILNGESPPGVTPLRERSEEGLPPSLMANALIHSPESGEALEAGETVTVELITQ